MLAANSAWHHAWPSVSVNLIWIGVGIAALVRFRMKRFRSMIRRWQLSATERRLPHRRLQPSRQRIKAIPNLLCLHATGFG